MIKLLYAVNTWLDTNDPVLSVENGFSSVCACLLFDQNERQLSNDLFTCNNQSKFFLGLIQWCVLLLELFI